MLLCWDSDGAISVSPAVSFTHGPFPELELPLIASYSIETA